MKAATQHNILTLAFALFCLSGCMVTEELWSQYEPNKGYDEHIHAFGFTKPDSKNLPPNRLLMLGEKAAYVTEITPEHDLVKALRTTDLSKQFWYGDYVKITNDKDGSFIAANGRKLLSYCLKYDLHRTDKTVQNREIPKLIALGFEEDTSEKPRLVYKRCYDKIHGKIYPMSKKLPAEYHFQYPIKIRVNYQNAQPNWGQGVGLALLTPLSIIGDIILLPYYVPEDSRM